MTSPVSPSTIAALPTAPNRMTDTSDDFVTHGDAYMAAWPTFRDQMNTSAAQTYQNAVSANESAVAAAASAAAAATAASTATGAVGYVRRSTDNLSVGTGTKNLTGLNSPSVASFANGDDVVIIEASDFTTWMRGAVSSANMAAGTMTVTVTGSSNFNGSGSHSDWIVAHADVVPPRPASATDVRTGTDNSRSVASASLASAAAFLSLTDVSTIAWNVTQGMNATVTLLASGHTMGAPTNLIDGITYSLEIVQGNTGSNSMTWNSIWDFGAAGLPVLQTAVGKADRVFGQYNARTGKIDATFRKGA